MRRLLKVVGLAAALLLATVSLAAAATNTVITCSIAGTNGGQFCVNTTYDALQVKAADGTYSLPYGWAISNGGPSGTRSVYTWTAMIDTVSGQQLFIDNQFCNCGTVGTYKANVYFR